MSGLPPYDAMRWALGVAPPRNYLAFRLLIAHLSFANAKQGFSYPTQRQLAGVLYFGNRDAAVDDWQVESIRKGNKVLIDLGLIEIISKGYKGHATRYRVLTSTLSPSSEVGETEIADSPYEAGGLPLDKVGLPLDDQADTPSSAPSPKSQPEEPDLKGQSGRATTSSPSPGSQISKATDPRAATQVETSLDFDFPLRGSKSDSASETSSDIGGDCRDFDALPRAFPQADQPSPNKRRHPTGSIEARGQRAASQQPTAKARPTGSTSTKAQPIDEDTGYSDDDDCRELRSRHPWAKKANNYPGRCVDCNFWVLGQMGYIEHSNGSWLIHHLPGTCVGSEPSPDDLVRGARWYCAMYLMEVAHKSTCGMTQREGNLYDTWYHEVDRQWSAALGHRVAASTIPDDFWAAYAEVFRLDWANQKEGLKALDEMFFPRTTDDYGY